MKDKAKKSGNGKHHAAVSRDRLDRWLEKASAEYPSGQELLIPLLQSAQSEFGYLPQEAMEAIARYLRMPPAQVQGVASFYAQFRYSPPGRHRVTVCRGTACHVRGSGVLLDELSASLGVKPMETTADGAFTLETVACFGSCALAPVMVVDKKVYGRQTAAVAKKTVEKVGRSGKKTASGTRTRRKS